MERPHGPAQKSEAGLQKRLMKFVGKLKSPGSPRRSSRSTGSSQRSSFAKESDTADADDEHDVPSGSTIQPPHETAGSQFQPSVRASTDSDWDVMGDGARSHGPSLEISPFSGEGPGRDPGVGTIEEEDREGEDLNGTWVARTADAHRRDWKVRTAFSTTSQEHSTTTRGSTDTFSSLSTQQPSINMQQPSWASWAASPSSPAWSPATGGGSTAGGTAGGTASSTPRRKSATMSKVAARRVSADLARRIAEIQEHVAGLTENDMLDPNTNHLDKIKQLSHRPRHANTSEFSSDRNCSESKATSTANALGYNPAYSQTGSPHAAHPPQSSSPTPAVYTYSRQSTASLPATNQQPPQSQGHHVSFKQEQEENSFLVKLQTKLFDQEHPDQHGVSGWDMPKPVTPVRSPTQSNTSLPLMSALYAPGVLQSPGNSGQAAGVPAGRVSSVMSVGSAASTTTSSTSRQLVDSPTVVRPGVSSMLRNQQGLLDTPAGNSHASNHGSSFTTTENLMMPFHPVAASMHQAAGSAGSTGSTAHIRVAGGYTRATSAGVVDSPQALQGGVEQPRSLGAAAALASANVLPPAVSAAASAVLPPPGPQAVQAAQAVQAVQAPLAAGMPAWPTGGKQLLKMVHARSQGTQAVAHNVLAALRNKPPSTANSTSVPLPVLQSAAVVSAAAGVSPYEPALSGTTAGTNSPHRNHNRSPSATDSSPQSAPLQYITGSHTGSNENLQKRHGHPTQHPPTISPSPTRHTSMHPHTGVTSLTHTSRPPVRRASMNDAGRSGMMQAAPLHSTNSNLSITSSGMRSGASKLQRRSSMLTVLPEDSQQIMPDVNMSINPLFPIASILHSTGSNHGIGVGHIRSIQAPPPSAPGSYEEHQGPLPRTTPGHNQDISHSAPQAFFLMSHQSDEMGHPRHTPTGDGKSYNSWPVLTKVQHRPPGGGVTQQGWAGKPEDEERVPDMVLDESGNLVPVPHHSFLSTTQSLGAVRSQTDVSVDGGNSSSRLQNQEVVPGRDGTGSGASQRTATRHAAPRRNASAGSENSAGSTYVWSRVQSLLDGLMVSTTRAQQSRRGAHGSHAGNQEGIKGPTPLLSPGMVGCLVVGVCFTLLLNTLVLLVALLVMRSLVNNQGTCRAA